MAAIGSRFGLRAARIPLEPLQVLRRSSGRRHGRRHCSRHPLRCCFAGACALPASSHPITPSDFQWSGQLTRDRLSGLIRNLPDGLSEIYLHPATGPFPGAAPGYRYREEFDALMASDIVAACRDSSLQLGGFRIPGSPRRHYTGPASRKRAQQEF